MALDLRGCGIGNVVLAAAAHLVDCTERGATPVIVHDASDELRVIDLGYFRVTPDATLADPSLNARYVNIRTLAFKKNLGDAMRAIVVPREVPVDVTGVEAGFCFRVSVPELDGAEEFMNETAVERMISEMQRYKKVFVCSNSEDLLHRVASSHPDVVHLPWNDAGEVRNADDHVLQWHALAKCPLVYHGIGGPSNRASTFAPVAAAYGRGPLPFGITNTGETCIGRWA